MATLAPDLFPPAFRDHHGRVGLYFEAAAGFVTRGLVGAGPCGGALPDQNSEA
jgi:Cu+-exporting ATPase